MTFFFCSEARAGLKEFLCDLCIDGCILEKEKCIPYKYYLAGNALPYEFLYGVKCNSSEVVNRCLVVPTKDFRLGGKLHVCLARIKYEILTSMLWVIRHYSMVKIYSHIMYTFLWFSAH